MVGGGLATIICLMFLAWVREIVSGILGIFGADAQSKGVIVTTQVLATIMMFCLDFAINTGTLRSFCVFLAEPILIFDFFLWRYSASWHSSFYSRLCSSSSTGTSKCLG